MIWAVILFIVFAALASWLIYAASPPPPDDALAIRLAADLGAASPTLFEDDGARYWWFALPTDPRTDVLVADRSVRVRRTPTGPITHAATLLVDPLIGRDQEMYESRTVVPGFEGGLMIGGEPNASLEGWELRLNAKILETMRSLRLHYVRVEPGAISTGLVMEEPVDAEPVLEVADFLRRLEELLVQQLH
jgi:hypothetical protein